MSDHARRYLASDGADGHLWRGVPTLVITTSGWRSGEQRCTALIYGRDGDRYVVVASKAGAVQHPWWYVNLVACPEVGVQVGAEKFTALARTAPADEKMRLWGIMVGIWPAYERYQAKTRREIPVVILKRV